MSATPAASPSPVTGQWREGLWSRCASCAMPVHQRPGSTIWAHPYGYPPGTTAHDGAPGREHPDPRPIVLDDDQQLPDRADRANPGHEVTKSHRAETAGRASRRDVPDAPEPSHGLPDRAERANQGRRAPGWPLRVRIMDAVLGWARRTEEFLPGILAGDREQPFTASVTGGA